MNQHKPDESRAFALGMAVNTFVEVRARGEQVDEHAFAARYPKIADELLEDLRQIRNLRPALTRIEALIPQGILSVSSDPQYVAEFGRFGILGCLGRGGMGIVLRAFDRELDRTVALKLLRPDLLDDPSAALRFEREARTAARIQHPNVVTIYEVGRTNGLPWIAMEWVDGLALAAVLHERQLRRDEVEHVAGQALLGLAAAHEVDVIHRDLKPDNILLACPRDSDGPASMAGPTALCRCGVKITDFGLARLAQEVGRDTRAGAIVGTPEYMSPEQVRGEPASPRSDVFAFGVVLAEMITGQSPFRADSTQATIHRVLNERPRGCGRMLARLPRLGTIALRCLEKRPEDRPDGAAGVLALTDRKRAMPRIRNRGSLRPFVAAGAALLITGVIARPSRPADSGPALRPEIAAVETAADARGLLIQRRGMAKPEQITLPPELAPDRIAASGLLVEENAVVVSLPEADAPAGQLLVLDDAFSLVRGFALEMQVNDALRNWPGQDPIVDWAVHGLRHGERDGCLLLDDFDQDGQQEAVLVMAAQTEAASNGGYLHCLVMVDLRTGDIERCLWHPGNLVGIAVEQAPEGSTLLVWGSNNKLDGPEDPVPPDWAGDRWTDYNKVPFLMRVDPRTMSGLAPPFGLMPLPDGVLEDYAFLDVPDSVTSYQPIDGGPQRVPAPEMCFRFRSVVPTNEGYDVTLACGDVDDEAPKVAYMKLNADFELVAIEFDDGMRDGREWDEGVVAERWRLPVKAGQLVLPPRQRAP